MKEKLLALLFSPTVVEFVVSKIFKKSNIAKLQPIEKTLESIKKSLIEQKMKFYKSQNPYDEEALNCTISSLKDFVMSINSMLEEVEAEKSTLPQKQ